MSHSQNQRRHLPKDYLRDKAGCGMLTTTPNPSAQNKKYLGWTDQLKAKQERLSFNLAVLGSLSTRGSEEVRILSEKTSGLGNRAFGGSYWARMAPANPAWH